MTISREQLQELLSEPKETLDVELKSWIDPKSPEGIAKIAKGCIALRNNNGGQLIIGFDNNGLPDKSNPPADVRRQFHPDEIQAIVAKYSSEAFVVDVHFIEREGQEYPVISVPPGIKTVVAAKADLANNNGKLLIKDHTVYVRSIHSNNTVSSTEARRTDWDRLIKICLDNREADIGAFVRRHLASLDLERMTGLLHIASRNQSRPCAIDRAKDYLDVGRRFFDAAMQDRGLNHGTIGYREAAILIDGDVPSQTPTESFLRRLFIAKPKHTGWSHWIDSSAARAEEDRPHVREGGWEALIIGKGDALLPPSLDFWRIDPQGLFYHMRALEDDLNKGRRGPEPQTQLDFLLQISRLTEIISIGLSFARSMECEESKTSLVFAFRWSGLKGRHLTSWVDRRRSFYPRGICYQDQIVTTAVIPLETPQSGIAPYVEMAVRELFAHFGGMEIDTKVVGDIVTDVLSQRF